MATRQLSLFCYSAAYYQPVERRRQWQITPGCYHCGGTGDAWDEDTNDWADPFTKCECCDGNGDH